MTREEAIRILDPETTREALAEIEYYGGFSGREAVVLAISDSLFLAIAALREREQRRWIPVTERLPDDWVDVLARLQCGDCVVAVKSGPIWRERFTNIRLEDGDITHWMPLPKPTKEE